MAEILSVVSAGAGLFSLSMQLLYSAQKLKGIYENYKNAPKFLEDLSSDLETLSIMLHGFECYRQEKITSQDLLLLRCITRLQGEVSSVEKYVEHLQERLKKHRLLGKLSTAFEEPKIQRYLDGLEKAKGTLLIVHHMYIECRRQHDAQEQQQTILAQLDRLLPQTVHREDVQKQRVELIRSRPSNEDQELSNSETGLEQNKSIEFGPSSSDETAILRRRDRELGALRPAFAFQLPQWLCGRVWSVAMSRGTAGLTLNLQTWSLVESSPAFEYCENGDLPSLRKLLVDGHASPRDRTLTGFSLLARAARAGHREICQMLLKDCGLATDLDAVDEALVVLSFYVHSRHYGPQQYRDMFEFFIKTSDVDCGLNEVCPETSTIPRWWWGCPDAGMQDLAFRKELDLNPDVTPFKPCHILEINIEHIGFRLQNPEVMLRMFGIGWSSSGLGQLSFNIKEHMLHLAAQRLSYYQGTQRYWVHSFRQRWFKLAHDLVAAGANPVSVLHKETALTRIPRPLTGYYAETFKSLQSRLDHLREWVTALADAGIDIAEYGQQEGRAWTETRFRDKHQRAALAGNPWPFGGDFFARRIIDDLMFGPSLHDWSLSIRQARILNVWKRPSPPGAWNDHSYIPDCEVRGWEFDNVEMLGWTKTRQVPIISDTMDLRDLQEDAEHDTNGFIQNVEKTQDDADPIALAVLWRRRVHSGRKRSLSQPPPVARHRYVRNSWFSQAHPWIPECHLYLMMLRDGSWRCRCLDGQQPESHQYKPAWFKSMCSGFISIYDSECVEDSADIQENERWRKFSFLAKHEV